MLEKNISYSLDQTSKALELSASWLRRKSQNIYPWRSLNKLDKKLSEIIPSLLSKETFYIEVGANDGIRQSNTLFLEKVFGASGLLIEASPSLFEKCMANRSKKNIFEHCALVPKGYSEKYMEFIYSDLMTVSTKVNDRIAEEHAKEGLKFMKTENYHFLSPAKTLSSIIDAYNIQKVDLLSLDLEGYEIEALKGAELERQIIKNILVEHPDFYSIKNFMEAHSYKYVQSLSDNDHLFSIACETHKDLRTAGD